MLIDNFPSIVIGASGQDGRLLTQQLLASGKSVLRWTRTGLFLASGHDQEGALLVAGLSVLDGQSVEKVFREYKPAEVYYLAAYHHSAEKREDNEARQLWRESMAVNFDGWLNCLLAASKVGQGARLFYASSCHIFGEPGVAPQDEQTPWHPLTPYAVSKVAAMNAARAFRKQGVFAATGILYNHESPFRKQDFVSSRIVHGLRAVKRGEKNCVELRNLSAVVDWGYAGDYTNAMQLIVRATEPDDFVIASGEPHTIRDITKLCCERLGLEHDSVIRETNAPAITQTYKPYIGNPTKLETALGWKRTMDFPALIEHLLTTEV